MVLNHLSHHIHFLIETTPPGLIKYISMTINQAPYLAHFKKQKQKTTTRAPTKQEWNFK